MVMHFLSVSRPIAAVVWVMTMAWSSGTFAEIYKWVDQKGVTNYSGAPPATGKAQTLDPGAVTVSVYQATAPQDAARLDSMMRQKVAMLENQLRAERLARQTRPTSTQAESDRRQLAYEQCVSDRRVDCDPMRDGLYAGNAYSPYYVAAAPLLVAGRPFPLTPFTPPITPFTRTPPAVLGTMVGGFPQPAAGSMRTATTDHRGLSRKFR